MTDAPGFWMLEISGVLRPAVEAYLAEAPMTGLQIATVRAYLRQWINAPVWEGSEVEALRREVDSLTTREALDGWLDRALEVGIDPL